MFFLFLGGDRVEPKMGSVRQKLCEREWDDAAIGWKWKHIKIKRNLATLPDVMCITCTLHSVLLISFGFITFHQQNWENQLEVPHKGVNTGKVPKVKNINLRSQGTSH